MKRVKGHKRRRWKWRRSQRKADEEEDEWRIERTKDNRRKKDEEDAGKEYKERKKKKMLNVEALMEMEAMKKLEMMEQKKSLTKIKPTHTHRWWASHLLVGNPSSFTNWTAFAQPLAIKKPNSNKR
jgi:hypothetical protein